MKEIPSIFEESSSDYLDDTFNPFDIEEQELSEEEEEEEEEEEDINLDEI